MSECTGLNAIEPLPSRDELDESVECPKIGGRAGPEGTLTVDPAHLIAPLIDSVSSTDQRSTGVGGQFELVKPPTTSDFDVDSAPKAKPVAVKHVKRVGHDVYGQRVQYGAPTERQRLVPPTVPTGEVVNSFPAGARFRYDPYHALGLPKLAYSPKKGVYEESITVHEPVFGPNDDFRPLTSEGATVANEDGGAPKAIPQTLKDPVALSSPKKKRQKKQPDVHVPDISLILPTKKWESIPQAVHERVRDKLTLCALYLNDECPYGSACPFRHERPTSSGPQPFPAKVCPGLQDHNRCLKDACPYYHGTISKFKREKDKSVERRQPYDPFEFLRPAQDPKMAVQAMVKNIFDAASSCNAPVRMPWLPAPPMQPMFSMMPWAAWSPMMEATEA